MYPQGWGERGLAQVPVVVKETLLLHPHPSSHICTRNAQQLFDLWTDICSMWPLIWFGEQKTS